jgi:O-antigen ligase
MPKRNVAAASQPSLQIFTTDWAMVALGILWMFILWTYGATPWQKIILGLGTVIWWGVGNWWARARQKRTLKKEFELSQIGVKWGFWWLAWLLVVVTNAFTSQIPVQSGVVVFWWLMSGLWFWWWSSLFNQELKKWLVVHILCGGILVLACASWIVAWFNPIFIIQNLLTISPNYLVPFSGHHHIAALIILIWPLCMVALRRRIVLVFWLVLLGVTVWFSFSRSAWLAIVLQVGVFFWLQRHEIKQNIKVWILGAGIAFTFLVIGFLLKDLMQSRPFVDLPKPIRQLCYQWWAPDTLCSVAPEPRLEYWRQAIIVWQHFPWFGSGLDTFGQAAKRWQTSTLFQTYYPHQVLLQVLSEQGIFASIIFLGFFGLLFFEFFQHLQRKTTLQNWPFFIAAFGAVVIGNFDFDWQLAGFWWPFLMVVSCITIPALSKSSAEHVLPFLLKIGLVIGGLGALVSTLTYIALMANSVDQWKFLLPYSAEWQSLAAKQIKTRTAWQDIVKKYYRQSPDIWFGAMTDVSDANERWNWLEQLWLYDPWRYWEMNPLATARKNHDLVQTAVVLDRLQQWLQKHPDSKVQKYNPAFAAELFDLADESLLREDWQSAEKALVLAQIFDPWILHNRFPSNAENVLKSEKIPTVLKIFSGLIQTNYGDNLTRYRSWYRLMVLQQVNSLLQQRVKRVGEAPISSQWLPITELNMSDWVNSVMLLGTQSLVLLPDPQSRGIDLSQKISGLLIEAGDVTVSTDKNRVSELYQLAQKIEPWVLNGKLWWFERLRLIKPSSSEFMSFAADWSNASAEVTGYKPHAWMLFYNRVLLLSLRSGDSATAFASLRAVQHYWMQAKVMLTP